MQQEITASTIYRDVLLVCLNNGIENSVEIAKFAAEVYDKEIAKLIFSSSPVEKDSNKEICLTDVILSIRTINSLLKNGINTLNELEYINEKKLLGFDNFGTASLNELKLACKNNNITIGRYDSQPY